MPDISRILNADRPLSLTSVPRGAQPLVMADLARAAKGRAVFIAPDEQAMRAVTDVVKTFQMPGHGIENFGRKSVQIAMAGIYDLRLHHDDVIMPVLRHWNVFDRDGLGPDGERAREELGAFLEALDAQATKFVDRRAENRARDAARADGRTPDIVAS